MFSCWGSHRLCTAMWTSLTSVVDCQRQNALWFLQRVISGVQIAALLSGDGVSSSFYFENEIVTSFNWRISCTEICHAGSVGWALEFLLSWRFFKLSAGTRHPRKSSLGFRIRWCSGGGNPAWLPKCNTDSTRICANMIQVDGNTEAECKSLFHWSIRIWRGGLGSCQSYMMTSAVHSFCITHPGLHLWETHVQTDCKPPWIFFSPIHRVAVVYGSRCYWKTAVGVEKTCNWSIRSLLGESPMQLFWGIFLIWNCFSPCGSDVEGLENQQPVSLTLSVSSWLFMVWLVGFSTRKHMHPSIET